jgi:hypothetical protein
MRPSIIEFIEKASKVPALDLRAMGVPCPRTMEELTGIIDAMASRNHNYGTCVYAMSISAEAAFNYISHILGVTDFQASCADMDFLRRTRHMPHFQILDLDRLLYPQYRNDFFLSCERLIAENMRWLPSALDAKLSEYKGPIHRNVINYWLHLWTLLSTQLPCRSRAWILIDKL